MASIILPGRWQTQPRNLVGLDERHPLFGNIASAGTVFNGVLCDVKANGILAPAGTTGVSVKAGQQFATTGTGLDDVWSLSAGRTLLPAQNAVSMLTQAYSNSYNVTRKRAIRFSNPTNGTVVNLDFSNGASIQLSAGLQVTGGTFPSVHANIPEPGVSSNILLTRLGTAMALYVDGVDATTTTANVSSNNLIGVTNQVLVGNNGTGFPLNGGVSLWALFNTDLTRDWARELYYNPWQIFRAKPRVLYFDVTAAPSVPTLSLPLATSITATSAVPQVTLTFT